MSSLPREVHEVLEQEYVSMYGPLERIPVAYTGDQIVDVAWALSILRSCRMQAENIDKEALAEKLNELLVELPPDLADSPVLTSIGELLLEHYEEYSETATKEGTLEELNRRILDDALGGAVKPLRDVRLDRIYTALHKRAQADDAKARTALCISGGGIRSATFALGIIQGLASAKILDKFDYLSTVSGGGYIGSWLSSWARRHPHGISGVQEDLRDADTGAGGTRHADADPKSVPARPPKLRGDKIEPEPEPLRHLREYSNYLSPRLGVMSADAWTMGALYLRNLLLNLLVLVPIFAAVLAIPRVYAWLSNETLYAHEWTYPILTVICLTMGFAYIGHHRPVEFEPPRSQGSDGEFVFRCLLPLVGAAIAMTLFWTDIALDPDELDNPWLAIPAAGAVVAMTVVPFVLYNRRLREAYRNTPQMAYADEAQLKKHLRRKTMWEAIGAACGMVAAAALLLLLAAKVFNQPLLGFADVIRDVTAHPPLLRTVSTIPWSSLYTVFAVPAVLVVFFIQATIFVGLSSSRNEDYDREWWGRAGAWLLVAAAGWVVLSGIAIFGPVALYHAPVVLGSIGGLSGVAAALLGFSDKTAANKREKEEAGVTGKAGNAALGLAVPLFVVFFLALISLATTWLTHELKPLFTETDSTDVKQFAFAAQLESGVRRITPATAHNESIQLTEVSKSAALVSIPQVRSFYHLRTVYQTTGWEAGVMLLLALGARFFSTRIGVNKFSMHALYRNRLIRAYLGASRYSRNPNPFTGFDERDNLQMWHLRPELLWSSNLKNPHEFFLALREGKRTTYTGLTSDPLERRKLAQYLWKTFYDKTRRLFEGGINSGSINAVIQNINEILLDEKQLLEEEVQLPDDFWTKTAPGQTPYPAAMRNRAVLDYYFKDVLTPMPRPKDVPSDATEVARQDGDSSFKLTGEGTSRRAPLHVVNIALNLVGGEKLAWQQRKAEPFTSSPYHSGSLFLGYRDSHHYGGRDGISLGTAVTISGAAASPNMGYHSSPALAFLLTLFNIRLGWWLGNPGPAGQKAYHQAHPDSNLRPILSEATGRTNDTYEWVYLSDGGHFENLGLYEMVLRRCHYIVLSDAGADPHHTFEDLGNAIRKIRTDLGVPIDIEEMFMLPRGADSMVKDGRYVATATIRYTAVDGCDAKNGVLIYLKPGVYNDDYFPRDVYNYAQDSPDFPHESTGDQFFSESQFESYRALGRHAINEICCNYPDRSERPPRIPIAKEFNHVGHFASFVKRKAEGTRDLPPAQLIATAIRELTARKES